MGLSMNIRCKNCGLLVQVPPGGRRLCGCGAWLSGEVKGESTPIPVAAVEEEAEVEAMEAGHGPGAWPRIEGDLSAIERLNDGYRRIRRELSKVIVGQDTVIEEMLISIFAR